MEPGIYDGYDDDLDSDDGEWSPSQWFALLLWAWSAYCMRPILRESILRKK